MIKPKIFIGPMSKNIVDSIIQFCELNDVNIGLVPSRRQVESNGGYVNNWTTEKFSEYVKLKTNKVLLVRDHGGPNQGSNPDDGLNSLKEDCKSLDMIHVDPWIKYPNYQDGLDSTVDIINFCYKNNPDINFEVGTEESIRKFSTKESGEFIEDLKLKLKKEVFEKITYLVIQSGTSLEGNINTGTYNKDRLIRMVNLAHSHDLLSKEHNGDYLSADVIKEKMSLGLDSINIAPEFGQVETQVYLNRIKKEKPDLIEIFYKICYNSNKWRKWVTKDFDPFQNKEELINICGHYVFSNSAFIKIIKNSFKGIDEDIKAAIIKKLTYHL
jgi:D-tagatose-1,6-bisphosphate aldolase subunit GatZ/KbaZ